MRPKSRKPLWVGSRHRGDLGIYSFNGNKIITASGGRMVSNDEEKVEKANLGAQAGTVRHYEHEVGYNYRLSNASELGRGRSECL